MFSRQRKKQEGQQRHQYEVANKYVFRCRLKVDNDDDDVTNDGKLFHARAAATAIHYESLRGAAGAVQMREESESGIRK